jgi:hypothetical protein
MAAAASRGRGRSLLISLAPVTGASVAGRPVTARRRNCRVTGRVTRQATCQETADG